MTRPLLFVTMVCTLLLVPFSMHAAQPITRAEFTKQIVDHLFTADPEGHCFSQISSKRDGTFKLLFSDVSIHHSAAVELCIAMREGLIRGYDDGRFRPDQPINAAEAGKILARAYALGYAPTSSTDPWFAPYMRTLSEQHAIPRSIATFDQHLTQEDYSEITLRLDYKVTWRPFQTYATLERSSWKNSRQSMTREPSSTNPKTQQSSSKAWYQLY